MIFKLNEPSGFVLLTIKNEGFQASLACRLRIRARYATKRTVIVRGRVRPSVKPWEGPLLG